MEGLCGQSVKVYWTYSVPKKDVCPLTQVILRLVKVAAVMQAASPVDCLAVEVLLVIGRELLTVILG